MQHGSDPGLTNGLRKCGIYAQWNFTQTQRRMKIFFFIFRQMDGTGEHHLM
jgi:hypothetical protein